MSVLVMADIRDMLIISISPTDLPNIECLLEDGPQYGVGLPSAEQLSQGGLAQDLIIVGGFCALVLRGTASSSVMVFPRYLYRAVARGAAASGYHMWTT